MATPRVPSIEEALHYARAVAIQGSGGRSYISDEDVRLFLLDIGACRARRARLSEAFLGRARVRLDVWRHGDLDALEGWRRNRAMSFWRERCRVYAGDTFMGEGCSRGHTYRYFETPMEADAWRDSPERDAIIEERERAFRAGEGSTLIVTHLDGLKEVVPPGGSIRHAFGVKDGVVQRAPAAEKWSAPAFPDALQSSHRPTAATLGDVRPDPADRL